MKVSGFTIVRNGNYFAYPYREAILSILPLVDEMIVNVGDSDDGTYETVVALDEPKIKIIRREWDMTQKEGGKVLSIETNAALEKCTGDWGFYIQADEVLHEKFYEHVASAMERELSNPKVLGLNFKYRHFYGNYDYFQDNYRNWYRRAVRIIKLGEGVYSWDDAMDFRFKDGTHIPKKDMNAEMYHYGWVKPPETMLKKRVEFNKIYLADGDDKKQDEDIVHYDDFGHLRRFEGTHPAVMRERIAISSWDFDARIDEQPPHWIRKFLVWLHPVTKRLKRCFAAAEKR